MKLRTTVTLDEDVAATVRNEMKTGNGMTFKEAVNELIRRGRYSNVGTNRPAKQFELTGRLLTTNRKVDFNKVSKLLEEVEGPDFK